MSRKPEIALSVRQPFAELIMRGQKKIEYRGVPTTKRERVYVYASRPPRPREDFDAVKLQPGDLPTGFLIGTVEITDCQGEPGNYEWHLSRPQRLKKLIKPKGQPQPVWFRPF